MMLEAMKKWFGRKEGRPERDWSVLQHWAEDRQFEWREVRGSDGFVIEGRHAPLPWRLEWGPSQRDYVKGFELRSPLMDLRAMSPEAREKHIADYKKGFTIKRI